MYFSGRGAVFFFFFRAGLYFSRPVPVHTPGGNSLNSYQASRFFVSHKVNEREVKTIIKEKKCFVRNKWVGIMNNEWRRWHKPKCMVPVLSLSDEHPLNHELLSSIC